MSRLVRCSLRRTARWRIPSQDPGRELIRERREIGQLAADVLIHSRAENFRSTLHETLLSHTGAISELCNPWYKGDSFARLHFPADSANHLDCTESR